MRLLNPAALLTGLLAIPILLMYMLRLRRQDRIVPSVLLWERVLRDQQVNTPWQRLKRNLLLILQLLILACFTMALARPTLPTPRGMVPGGEMAGEVVVLLDGSASMQAQDGSPTRFASARQTVHAWIDNLPSGTKMTLLLAAAQPEILSAQESDKSSLHRALDTAHPTQSSADWRAAFALAASAATGSQEVRFVILSDGGLPEGLPGLPGEVHYLRVGSSDQNLALAALALRPGANGVELFARVDNYGSSVTNTLVSIYRGNQLIHAEEISVPGSGSQSVLVEDLPYTSGEYSARLSPGFSDQVNIEVPLDRLPLDDAAYTVYHPEASGRILLVSEGNLFLEQALAVLPGAETFRLLPDESGALLLPEEPFAVTVFDNLTTQEMPTGNLLLINPPQGEILEVGDSFTDTAPVQIADNPLTRYVDWSQVRVAVARHIALPIWAEAMVSSPGGPLVLVGERDGQRIAALSFDLHASDLPLSVTFPILMSNLFDYLLETPLVEAREEIRPGGTVQIRLRAGSDPEQVRVITPWGESIAPLPGEGGLVFQEIWEPGIYQIIGSGDREGVLESFAVNLFESGESDIAPRESIQSGQSQVIAAPPDEPGQKEIWQWLALAAAFLLGLEWWVYQRGQRPG